MFESYAAELFFVSKDTAEYLPRPTKRTIQKCSKAARTNIFSDRSHLIPLSICKQDSLLEPLFDELMKLLIESQTPKPFDLQGAQTKTALALREQIEESFRRTSPSDRRETYTFLTKMSGASFP